MLFGAFQHDRHTMQSSPTRRLVTLLSCGLLGRAQACQSSQVTSCRSPVLLQKQLTYSTMPSLEVFDSSEPVKVLVLGGSYAGLAAALNLLDLCNSKPARFTPDQVTETPRVPVQIKIVDKRDGYCAYNQLLSLLCATC